MNLIIKNRLPKIRETQEFIKEYLKSKDKQKNKKIYLSIYLNLEKVKGSKLLYLKKKVQEIKTILSAKVSATDSEAIISQIEEGYLNDSFKFNSKSVAFFATDSFFGFLPINDHVEEGIFVAKSLHLKPIIKWVKNWNNYYIITISQKNVKLLKADDFEINEYLKIDQSPSKDSKEKDTTKDKFQFFKLAFEKINLTIAKDSFPVILAGVKENVDYCKKICKDPDISIYTMPGNFDHASYNEIHQQSLTIIKQINFDNDIILKTELRNSANKAIYDLKTIIKSAINGQIYKLLIAKDKNVWGEINRKSGEVEMYKSEKITIPEDDILDDLAEIVLEKGGKISAIEQREIPQQALALAILR